tara:strand:- start:2300 stop:2794 length:495 start_codon:yes stop_codon:yes gene_type:complete
MTMGKMYEYVGRHDVPTYPTLWQRIVQWVKSFFTREPVLVCDDGINLAGLACVGDANVQRVLDLLYSEGLTPTINRDTDKWQGHYVKVTDIRSKKDPRGGVKFVGGNFLKIAEGHNVSYFPLTICDGSLYNNPFYNVERIISTVGERDDIHKKVKRKAPTVKAA